MKENFTWIDSHCHLDLCEGELDDVLHRAHQAGVNTMLSIGTSRSNAKTIRAIAAKYSSVYASVGVHPTEVTEGDDLYSWLLEEAQDPKVIAFGETGLDFMPTSPPVSDQEESFYHHINAALVTGLPLIIHMRHSEEAFLSIMRQLPQRPRGVLHCFTGTLACAQEVIEWGWKISFSGILTFPNARDLREVAKQLPLSSLLLETDAPWLAPQKQRGKRNESSYLIYTAEVLADVLNVSIEHLSRATTENFYDLFPRARQRSSS